MQEQSQYRTGRPIQPGKRNWNGYEVDADLQDRWLENLNNLHRFHLTSICSGHPDERRATKRSPRVILKLIEEDMPSMVASWGEIRADLHALFSVYQIKERCNINFELICKARLINGEIRPPIDKFLVRIEPARNQAGQNNANWDEEFFDKAIQAAEEIDHFFSEIFVRLSLYG